jgi:hypothetical protein
MPLAEVKPMEVARRTRKVSLPGVISLAFVMALLITACAAREGRVYQETFDEDGTWGTGISADVEGQVIDGAYELFVKSNQGVYMATAGKSFGDGVYEVDAAQVEGPLNNGYGLLFRVDEADDSFYAFEVSGDGYVWIGYCTELCEAESIALVGGDWFRSPAVKTGLQETNNLKVIVNGIRMTFLVNGLEVGRAVDDRRSEGDVALMVEALGQPGVRVVFDNFSYTPQ